MMSCIGFFPITGDPIHYGHLHAGLQVRNVFGLQTVYLQVCGDLPSHKPSKASRIHRRAMTEIAVREFAPDLRYTPVGIDTMLVGEEAFCEFIKFPEFAGVEKFYYIAGSDNAEIVKLRLSQMTDSLTRPYEIVFLTRACCVAAPVGALTVESKIEASSYNIRALHDTTFLPKAVQQYCKTHRLYGFKPDSEKHWADLTRQHDWT